MAFDFPASPTEGQIYTPAGGPSYIYNAPVWKMVSPAAPPPVTSGIPAGTVMLFYQAAAPTGWTKLTTHNDKALRVVSGSGGVSGGTNLFSNVLINSPYVSVHTPDTNYMAQHQHSVSGGVYIHNQGAGGGMMPGGSGATYGSKVADYNGQSWGHNHTIAMDIQYIDLILASKD